MAANRDDIIECLNELAPESLAEPWDNSGLIIGTPKKDISRILVCLDVTDRTAGDAFRFGTQMIVAHHPLIFSPIKRIDSDDAGGALISRLIKNGVNVFCAHTNADRTYGGLNDLLSGIVGLATDERHGASDSGAGDSGAGDSGAAPYPDAMPELYRVGALPREFSAAELNAYICARLKQDDLQVAAMPQPMGGIARMAVMCGSLGVGAETLKRAGAQALLCGELKHHQALELAANGIYAICAGHHGTERFFLQLASKWIKDKFPDVEIICSGFDSYPLKAYHRVCDEQDRQPRA